MANEQNLKAKTADYDSTFHDEEVYRLALLGKTVKEIAVVFGHSQSTINRWFKQYPSFWEAVNRGRAYADAKVAEGLFKRATGFEIDSEKHFVVSTGDFKQDVKVVQTKTYFPPDPGAAMNWLKNRQPDTWRDKVDIGLPPEIVLTMKMDGEEDAKAKDDE